MAPLTPDWQRALSLLDAGLALPAEQREHWLDQMAAKEPGALPLLRKLLAAHGRVQTHEILATLPKVKRGPKTVDSGLAGLHVGPFELLEPLGRGGMGSVWRARYADARLKRDVAVKLPASTDDPVALRTLRERFARERDFLAQLQHPHIARLYDAGVSDNGQPFLAMEYVAGTAIDTYCDEKRLPVKARLQLFLQVLDAVAYAHQQLVLHRDLKAGNVLVDNKGQVRLLDFGVARLLPPPVAPQLGVAAAVDAATGAAAAAQDVVNGSDGVRVGTAEPAAAPTAGRPGESTDLTERAGAAFTLGHAAPEQISHGALSTATDVYALGVMLYRLLTGLSPYQPSRDTRGALEDAVLLATPAAASSRDFSLQALQARGSEAAALRKALQGDVDVILAKALKKNPAERYAAVTALADDLRRHLAQQPISARPDSWWYRSSRFVARNRVAVAATALASVALVGTAGVAGWQARVSARNAELAQKEAARANTAQKFFAGLLSKADPESNMNITAVDRQIADQALTRAEQDFGESPETLALVLKQLGEIYGRLGIGSKHVEVLKKRLHLLESMRGVPVDEVAEAQIAWAFALRFSDAAEERAMALKQSIAARDFAFSQGASEHLRVRSLCVLADIHLQEGRLKLADELAAEAVALAKATNHPQRSNLAMAYDQRGATATRLGNFDAARASFREALEIGDHAPKRARAAQLNSRTNLANSEYAAGNYQAARDEALEALEYARANLGEMEGTLTPLRVRAVLASERAGDLETASRLALSLFAPDLASGDPGRVARAQVAQGIVAVSLGKFDRAAQDFSRAESGLRNEPRWAHFLALQQAKLQLKRGDVAHAHTALSGLVEELRIAEGPSSESLAAASEVLGVAKVRLAQPELARTYFEEVCAKHRLYLKPAHPSRVRCEAYLILLSRQFSALERRRALAAQVQSLVELRTDRMALTASLQHAIGWVERASAGAASYATFPLLD